MYLCESYGKMIEYNEKLRRNREAPSDQKEPMEPYVGQDATVFVVEIKVRSPLFEPPTHTLSDASRPL